MSEPPSEPPRRILVTDDDPGVRTLLQEVLEDAGYEVDTACDGGEALQKIRRRAPDLVLLDIEMPVMNGWQVVKTLKGEDILQHLPVLLLTSLSHSQSKVMGLDLGADDYLTKPFNVGELLARVRSALRRTRAGLEANALTHLPGNNTIEREILSRIKSGAKFAVLYADLNNFKAFNDRYGFLRGDRVIQGAAMILVAARQPGDFVGHVGGDDFIMLTVPERAEEACRKVIADFDAFAPTQYDAEDQARGFIEVPDRQGHPCRFPLLGIAIGGVSNDRRALTSLGQVSALGAEMKKFAKGSGRSAYAFDRRID